MSEETGKKKLTLTVDEKVIEKAKSLGFNLSEVTESILRSFYLQEDEEPVVHCPDVGVDARGQPSFASLDVLQVPLYDWVRAD